MWVVIALIMGFSVFGSYGMHSTSGVDAGNCEWDASQNYMNMVFGTLGWATAITLIIFAGLFGYGGWVTGLLAADIFCPLSRLVYGAYLVHPMLMYTLDYSGGEKEDWYGLRIAIDFLGLGVASFATSFIGHLLLEKPLNNVQKIVLPAGR